MKVLQHSSSVTIYEGDVREVLPTLPDESVHCVVTSPPYWGLRDYGVADQLGLESTPELYISNMTAVFREVRRVLRADGTLWLNMGDSYASNAGTDRKPTTLDGPDVPSGWSNRCQPTRVGIVSKSKRIERGSGRWGGGNAPAVGELKPKDLCGIPWMLAFALRADGWYLRQDIIWSKPNPMPESVTDRCTKAHEYIFLMSKSERYYYNQEATLEPIALSSYGRINQDVDAQIGSDRVPGKNNGNMKAVVRVPANYKGSVPGRKDGPGQDRRSSKDRGRDEAGLRPGSPFGREAVWRDNPQPMMRNRRSVWTVSTQSFSEAHFATFPEELIKPCILAGCPAGGTVLDPFFGSGTTGLVARANNCKAIGIELNPAYIEIAQRRLAQKVFDFNGTDQGQSPCFGQRTHPIDISHGE